MDKDTAIRELAHVARHLLERLKQVDDKLPGAISQALSSKIDFYALAEEHITT